MGKELHPSQQALLAFFNYDHLPADLKRVSAPFADLAHKLTDMVFAGTVTPSPELTVALRKLLEAKDCAVRAALRFESEGDEVA